jgi:hypothetical protein
LWWHYQVISFWNQNPQRDQRWWCINIFSELIANIWKSLWYFSLFCRSCDRIFIMLLLLLFLFCTECRIIYLYMALVNIGRNKTGNGWFHLTSFSMFSTVSVWWGRIILDAIVTDASLCVCIVARTDFLFNT